MSYDEAERRIAARLGRSHPRWHVMWGCYSRVFWAYPVSVALPPGTILADPDPVELEGRIRGLEITAGQPGHAGPVGRPAGW